MVDVTIVSGLHVRWRVEVVVLGGLWQFGKRFEKEFEFEFEGGLGRKDLFI